ncbi:VOC family protein [Streptomyces sp. ICBB 8177]|uniref:VOC family protein n=1 Tax=Streptomyces sp. ICBB 8177 TaxID=563922 RepID=UPI000D683219|nr:VOC family protein [Streptomyces sp. ICBB 8177]PWI45501.1 lactoylglutathione lyase [Streptomyces sp. ICBB 8177]
MTATPRAAALPERWFRTLPDASGLERSRVLARSLIPLAELDRHIAFHEDLLGVPASLRMPIPDFGGLELAAVGDLLLIASERPFTPVQRRTAYSLIVPSLADELARLEGTGTTVLEPVEDILPGARARVRYPDGTLAELVEHRPRPGETPCPPAVPEGRVPSGVRVLARRAVPRAGFTEMVALYEELLATAAGPRGRGAAAVGNVLVVADDAASHDGGAGDEGARAALLAPDAAAADALRQLVAVGGSFGRNATRTVTLIGGTPAEVWNADDLGDPGAVAAPAGSAHRPG